MKKQILSDKGECQNENWSHAKECPDDNCDIYYREKDIKQFIKELKISASYCVLKEDEEHIVKEIDKLAGEELTYRIT